MQIEAEYTKVIARKYPEQVVIAIAKDENGKFNPITLGWTMIASGTPPMMAIAIGLGRYSLEVIRSAGCFTIAFPSREMEKETLYHGTWSGRERDKFADMSSQVSPASIIESVVMLDAVANFECELESELPTGDHVLFVGRIVASHMNQDTSVKRLYTIGTGHRMSAIEVVKH